MLDNDDEDPCAEIFLMMVLFIWLQLKVIYRLAKFVFERLDMGARFIWAYFFYPEQLQDNVNGYYRLVNIEMEEFL